MRTSTSYGQTPPPPGYSPSVPLHVYRELATELQAVQAKLDTVTAHNQKLAQENQLLRHEIARVALAVEQLQKLADSSSIPYIPPKPRPQPEANQTPPQTQPSVEVRNTPQEPRPTTEVKNTPKPPQRSAAPRPRPPKAPPKQRRREEFYLEPITEIAYTMPESAYETTYLEEEEVRYYPAPASELKELSGWWLIIMILVIILTGFSAGYFFVRPFFQSPTR
ncbi:MAG TPA: hypothetical protein VK184_11175 [Nostocaceae cyanobacterium]|nr:hypothetical protein [Nostocaceae cyanobacterium]